MLYVFDTSSLRELFEHFYESRFPKLWSLFDAVVAEDRLVSVREVANEIPRTARSGRLVEWAKARKHLFAEPTRPELECVRAIFTYKGGHFQTLVEEKKRLSGWPVADPFVIARAKVLNACLVTEEDKKDNATRIPNVCDYLNVDCTNLEGFMEREGWTF